LSVTLITTEPLVADSCGAGRYRGGLGIQRSYRVLADDALLQLRADRLKFAPYGLEKLGGKIAMTLQRGDLVTHVQAGGGGFGNPLLRDPAKVGADVWNQKISADYARTHHRVVVDGSTGGVDLKATQALREEQVIS
jgi:N-methylhydantoinase B